MTLAELFSDHDGVLVKGDRLRVRPVTELEELAHGVHVLWHKDYNAVSGFAGIRNHIHLGLHGSQGVADAGLILQDGFQITSLQGTGIH